MSIERLTEYGAELVEAGFEVWLTETGYRQGGYLQYRDPATGNCGSLQYSESLPGWQHLMPLVPTQEYGSSMFIGKPLDVWTVEAARQCASDTNHNLIVGTRPNAKGQTWRSAKAMALHGIPPVEQGYAVKACTCSHPENTGPHGADCPCKA